MTRELNIFEQAERKRIAFDIMSGFIKKEDIFTILKRKIELILLGVIAQSVTELRHYEGNVENTTAENDAIQRLQLNLDYLIETIIPVTLNMNFLEGVKVNVETITKMYYQIGRNLNKVENRVVPGYNVEFEVDRVARWNDVESKCMIGPKLLREAKRYKTAQ